MTTALPIVKGTLDLLALKALGQGPMHGFEVVQWIEGRSGKRLEIEESALYQALYRMEARNLIAAEWGVTENNRRARYYRILAAGRKHLERETKTWVRYSETVVGILTAAEAGA